MQCGIQGRAEDPENIFVEDAAGRTQSLEIWKTKTKLEVAQAQRKTGCGTLC